MKETTNRSPDSRWTRLSEILRARFSLLDDKADDEEIDARIRSDVPMQGTNLWVLMFAIFVASIGLNVNSTPVIIGAMLISPLMGPIMGIGYGAGILDLRLVRDGLKNLGIATVIGLLTSTAYFAVSPLRAAQAELLARTTPTIWDVLIATFGGLAGIVAATRKHKSNVIPGVAIATALMPPLCTAGFGLASGSWRYFLGASYLFAINCVFIAAASTIITRLFHVRHVSFVDARSERRVRRTLATVVLVTTLPSLYLAYELVGEEVFRARASAFVERQMVFQGAHVANVTLDPKRRLIQVSLVGAEVPKGELQNIQSRLAGAGLTGAELQVFQAQGERINVASLRSDLLGDLYREAKADVAAKDAEIRKLESELAEVQGRSSAFVGVPEEVHALYPQVTSLVIAQGPEWKAGAGYDAAHTVVAIVRAPSRWTNADQTQLEQWLRARFKVSEVRVVVDRQPPAASSRNEKR